MNTRIIFNGIFVFSMLFLFSCSSVKKVTQQWEMNVLNDSAFQQAHVGIAIYDAGLNRFLFQHNSNKYFVPASNTKLPTLYAGMKYLGDSITALLYAERNDSVFLEPTGDPTFLHADYRDQPAFHFLKQKQKVLVLNTGSWKTDALGYGWSWDDYLSSYAAERSPMPIYGNVVKWIQQRTVETRDGVTDTASLFFTDPEVNWSVTFSTKPSAAFRVTRPRTENSYTITEGRELKREMDIPFVTNGFTATIELLQDSLHKEVVLTNRSDVSIPEWKPLFSQPADSLFKPLMYRSDNFFAEQILLMVSHRLLGYMDEQRLIDTLLKTDLKEFPQKPRWVDGSGLSRYNLFSPEDFVWLLKKMKDEFGMERMKRILPTGNTGTLRNYYIEESGFLFAKTGTLSGHVALSGYLVTEKNKLLLFSVLVNHHNLSATVIRRAVETFLKEVRKKY